MSLADAGLASASLSGESAPSRHHRLYPVLFPLAVFVLTRLFAVLLIATSSKHQIALGPDTIPGLFVFHPSPADPGYLGITTNWDGQWYESIATNGYHSTGPGEVATHATTWAWAFPPAFPLLVGRVMVLTGLSFAVASTIVTCVTGAAAMVVLFRLLDDAGGRWLATCGVILSCCFVSAPLLQAAYSESLALLLLLAALLLVRRHRFWWAMLPTAGLMFTRLITPVLAVVVVVVLANRIRSAGWRALPRRQAVGGTVLAALAAAGGLVWPSLAASLMGEVGRFNRGSQLATGSGLGWFGTLASSVGWSGVVILCAAFGVLVWGAVSPRSASWGLELRTWSVAYPLYVLALTPITGGVLRYALLAPTLGLLLVGRAEGGRPRGAQVAVVVLGALSGLVCQYLFVRHMMVIDSHPLML